MSTPKIVQACDGLLLKERDHGYFLREILDMSISQLDNGLPIKAPVVDWYDFSDLAPEFFLEVASLRDII